MFTAEKAIFDAMNSNNIDLNDEKTVWEMISNTLGKNALPLWALWLIMAFFWGKSRTIWLSLLGLAIWWPVVGDIVSKFEKWSKKWKWSIWSFTDEELWLIKTSDIKYSLFNEEYQSQYEKLADLNKTNMKTQYDKESHRKLPFLDSKKLFKIVDVITSKKINFEFDDYDAVDKLSAKLSVKWAITEEDKLKARLEVIETKKEIPKKEEAIKKVNTSIQSKESKISIKEEAIKKAKAENKDTKTLETELNTLKSDLKKLEDDLKKLNKELEDIKQKLGNNQMKLIISSSEFTQEDIKNFLLLLKSPDFNHDEDDETLLDYLSSDWLDTLNKSYESIRFLDWSDDEDTYFNSEINKVLSNDFDKDWNDTRNKEKILKVREKIEELWQTWKNCLEESFNWKAGIYSRIVELKSYIKKTTPELSGKLDSIFDNFEKYAKVKEKLKNYEWIFDDNTLSWSDLTKAINTISFESFDSIKNLEKEQIYTLSIDISKEIKELEKLKIKDEDNNIDPFKNINEKIEKLIKELREKYTNLDDEYREKTGESLGNIDIIISPKEFFEDKEKAWKLESRISRQLNEYVEIIEILKEDKSIWTTSVYLKDAEKIQRELDRYTEKLKWVSVTYKDTDPKIFKTAQKSILKNIRAYEMKKDELKATVKENIKKYYADNQKDLKDLSKLKFNSLEDINNSLAKIDDIKEKSNFSYRYTQKAKEVFLDIKKILNETTWDVIDSEEYKELAKISNEAIEYIYTSIPDVDYQGNFEKIKGFVWKVELALDAYIAKHEAKKELKKQKAKVEGIKESSEEGLSVVQLWKKAWLEAEDLSKSKVKVAWEEVPLDTDATSKKVEEKAEEKKGKAENAAETWLKSLNLDGIEKNKLKPTAKIIMNIRDEFPSNNTIQELSKSKLEILREKYFNETKISEEPSILTDWLKKDASENNLNTFINDLGWARKINEMTIRELWEKIDEYKNEYNNNNTVQISDDTFKETIKVIYNIFKI